MPTDEQLRRAMAQAMTGFASVVATIEPDEWDRSSPCEGWSVFDVVDHVVAGDRFAAKVLAGASLADAVDGLVGLDPAGADTIESVTRAAGQALAAFGGSLDRVVDHPVGSIAARRFLGFRVIDQLGHTWDVAAATDGGVDLDAGALSVAVEIALAERETLERSRNFATSPGDRVETGDPLTTFLRTIGRRPAG